MSKPTTSLPPTIRNLEGEGETAISRDIHKKLLGGTRISIAELMERDLPGSPDVYCLELCKEMPKADLGTAGNYLPKYTQLVALAGTLSDNPTGCSSIKLTTSTTPPRSFTFALCAISIWSLLYSAHFSQTKLERSFHWLQQRASEPDTPDEVKEYIRTTVGRIKALYWETVFSTSYTGRKTPITVFLGILGSNWLTDDHISVLIQLLQDRLARDPIRAAKHVVFDYMQTRLLFANSSHVTQDFQASVNKLIGNPNAMAYAISFVGENHWVAFVMDIHNQQVYHGMQRSLCTEHLLIK